MGLSWLILLSSDPIFCWSTNWYFGVIPPSTDEQLQKNCWLMILEGYTHTGRPFLRVQVKLAYPIYGDYQWLSLSVTWESPFTNHQQAVFEQVLLPLGSTYQCGTPKNHGWSSSKSHVAVLSEGNKQCTVFGSCCHDYAERCAKHATCKAYGCGTYRRFHACQWRMVGMMREWRELGSM